MKFISSESRGVKFISLFVSLSEKLKSPTSPLTFSWIDLDKMSPFSLKFHKVGEYYVPKLRDLG